jgi:hypothetical protein
MPARPTVLRPELPPQIDEVFGRVLAKRPDERYGSCREFIQAARMALGIAGPHTVSSPGYGAPATAPAGALAASALAASATEADRPAGSTPTSHPHVAAQPWTGQPPDRPGQQAGAALPPAAPPAGPRAPRWYRRPRWIAVLAAVVLVLAGLSTWAGLRGSGSHHGAAAPASPKPKHTTSALMAALTLADKSADAIGLIPPSTCKQGGAATVTCTAPAPGISGAVFQAYPSQDALYAAYTAKVASLSPGRQFKQNFHDCESQLTYGEAGWNHQFQHTTKYTVTQMITGSVTDDQAAGRVFCNYTQGLEYMVWTQNDGHLMGYVAGPVHTDVWNWWVAVHHNIGIGGSPMNMQMPGTSPSPSPSPSMSSMSPSPSMSPSMSGMSG